MEPKKLLDLDHARTPEQIALMQKIIDDGVCPFCKEYFKDYHPKPILKETEYWFLTENMSPYAGTKHHFILVYKPAHITQIEELPKDAMPDLLELTQWISTEYGFPGGSLFMRFGDGKYNGSSVAHLHAQLLQGDCDAPGHEHVKVKLG